MAVTVASLTERFPEIGPTPEAVVTRAISEATRRTSLAALGARYDDAVALRAMHLLAVSPQGLNARLDTKPSDNPLRASTYGQELLALQREAAGGPHMIGCGPLA